MILVEARIRKSELSKLAKKRFGDLVKAVVDVKQEVMILGGELHSDEEALLLEQGSIHKMIQNLVLGNAKACEIHLS